MATTPTAAPVAKIAEPNAYRLGFLTRTILELDDSPATAELLAALDECEADIIRASHAHGIELDARSRDALGRILANSEGLR